MPKDRAVDIRPPLGTLRRRYVIANNAKQTIKLSENVRAPIYIFQRGLKIAKRPEPHDVSR